MSSNAPWPVAVVLAILPVVTYFLGQHFQVKRDEVAAVRASDERTAERSAARDEREEQRAADAAAVRARRDHDEANQEREREQDSLRALTQAFVAVLEGAQATLATLQTTSRRRDQGRAADASEDAYNALLTAIANLRVLNPWPGFDEDMSNVWQSTTAAYVALRSSSDIQPIAGAISDLQALIVKLPDDMHFAFELAKPNS